LPILWHADHWPVAQEAATRQFPSQAATQQPMAGLTSPVYLPPERPYGYTGAPMEQPRRKRRWPWVLGIVLGVLVFVGGVAGIAGFFFLTRTQRTVPISVNVNEGDAITREIPLAPGGSFSLTTDFGDVSISTWDREVVSIEGKKHLGSDEEQSQLEIEIDTSAPNSVIVHTTRPDDSQAHLDYEIRLPRQVNIESVEIKGNGDIQIKGVNGNITVRTVSGDIQMEDVAGNVNTSTVSGDTEVEMRPAAKPEDMNFNTVSGDVSLRLRGDFNANLNIATVSGSVDMRGDVQLFIEREIGNKLATGHIGQGGPQTIHIKTVSGDIQVRK
jgi:hypothetical protein